MNQGSRPLRFAIAWHASMPRAIEEAQQIAAALVDLGAREVFQASLHDDGLIRAVNEGRVEVLISLGGDGTILRAAHLCAARGVPILGINLGRFGFLTEVHDLKWQEALPRLCSGNYRLEERMMLRAELVRAGTVLESWDVLNEIVVCRGQVVRPIHVEASLDGYRLASYVADGLIVATPTGSTAYALAAGGPIMPPELRNVLIVPVAPHLSMDRAIILQEGAEVTIRAKASHQPVISVDGQPSIPLNEDDAVVARAGRHGVKFIRFSDPGTFYRNLSRYMEQNPITGGTL